MKTIKSGAKPLLFVFLKKDDWFGFASCCHWLVYRWMLLRPRTSRRSYVDGKDEQNREILYQFKKKKFFHLSCIKNASGFVGRDLDPQFIAV